MYEEKGNKRAGHLESQPFVVFVRDSITLSISTSTNVWYGGGVREFEFLHIIIPSPIEVLWGGCLRFITVDIYPSVVTDIYIYIGPALYDI
jgi:hypothetical protein